MLFRDAHYGLQRFDDLLLVDGSPAGQIARNEFFGAPTGPIAATADVTLGALTSSATARLKITGTGSVTLGLLTGSASAAIAITGAGSVTLDSLTGSATGELGALPITGTGSATLGELTGSAASKIKITGTGSATLGALTTASAVATLAIAGSVNATLGALAGASTATIKITGAASSNLGALVGSGGGTLSISGGASGALEALTAESTAKIKLKGSGSAALGELSASATAIIRTPPLNAQERAWLRGMALANGLTGSLLTPAEGTGQRRNGADLVQDVTVSGDAWTVSPVTVPSGASGTSQLLAQDRLWLEQLARIHGLIDPLTVNATQRTDGTLTQTITRVGPDVQVQT